MKTISLWQPWATLIGLGVKHIETRDWRTNYRGPLAIHAAKGHMMNVSSRFVVGAVDLVIGDYKIDWGLDPAHSSSTNGGFDEGCGYLLVQDGEQWPLPLGAIVATCELVDCLPMVATGGNLLPCLEVGMTLTEWTSADYWHNESDERDHSDQRPYGDFTVGRWAWMLTDIKPVDPPVPTKGHQGLWTADIERQP